MSLSGVIAADPSWVTTGIKAFVSYEAHTELRWSILDRRSCVGFSDAAALRCLARCGCRRRRSAKARNRVMWIRDVSAGSMGI